MRILIVEDEHKIAHAIKKGLEQEAYAVDVAYDGREGLDMALGEEYDVLLLDRMLPQLDGVTIVKDLRNNRIHTPILMLTAKGQVHDRIDGLDSGADDYLIKPFAFSELLARIRALTRRPRQTNSSILSVHNLTLNPATFDVQQNGKSLIMSRKEFSLLEYLMRHPNTILTKDQIISHVWNYDADVLPNTVEVYIGYLRKKVQGNLIHTIRGFGYKIGEK
jgi:DNA-binding response OmpR family regulator